MNRTTKTLTAAALCLVAAFTACKKKSDNTVDTKALDKAFWLSDTTWKLVFSGLDYNHDGVIDADLPSGAVADCVFDNSYLFGANGTGIVNDSTFRCDTAIAVSAPFHWAFEDNTQSIVFSGTNFYGLSGKFKVYELTANRFTLARDTLVRIPQVPQPVTSSIVYHLRP